MAQVQDLIYGINENNSLNDREKAILRTIVHLYLLNASPVGSRNLAKYLQKEVKLSPATIRNVMADLEELQYISHPHTSAGRIPTDKGYRFYVDSLMSPSYLSELEISAVQKKLSTSNTDSVLKEASKVLGMLSQYLAIVEIPHLADLIIQKIELISLSSTRLLVVLALDSNIVKTLTLEAEFEVDLKFLEEITIFINERVSGKKLSYFRENFRDMINEFGSLETPLIRLFVESVDELFSAKSNSDRIHIAGTPNLLSHPEFSNLKKVQGVIELIENEDIIVHILDKYESPDEGVKVLIGKEMQHEQLKDYSLVVSNYELGSAKGSIGIIGPKRMNYSKMLSLVEYVSTMISKFSV